LSALENGYEVFIVTDASGGTSVESLQAAVRRLEVAGARALTALLERQRDW
jgi:nicotinamidase-related amidase